MSTPQITMYTTTEVMDPSAPPGAGVRYFSCSPFDPYELSEQLKIALNL